MSADTMYGWDLTYQTVINNVKQKSDVLIAFIHWNMTKRGFRSIGIGDERTITGDEVKSELLPTGWNEKENYTLRYVLDGKLYIMHGLTTDGNLIVNLMRSDDLQVVNLTILADDAVKQTKGPIEKMMPEYKELMFNIKRDLIEGIAERPTTTSETQTSSRPRRIDDDPLRIPARPRPGVNPDSQDLWEYPPAGLPNIGRSDLDPFAPAGGGGGMIFHPFAPHRDAENPGLGIPGGLPRGAVPPGARFDPFAPPVVPRPPGRGGMLPDADHMPPPGFNDHMFM